MFCAHRFSHAISQLTDSYSLVNDRLIEVFPFFSVICYKLPTLDCSRRHPGLTCPVSSQGLCQTEMCRYLVQTQIFGSLPPQHYLVPDLL